MKKFAFLLFVVFAFTFHSNLFAQETKTSSIQSSTTGANPSWTKGNKDAKIRLEIFNDYQCPTCRVFNEKLKTLEKKFPNDLRITFRNFPLMIHHYSQLAAQAVEAAGMQGKFWEMANLILDRQKAWEYSKTAQDDFINYAKTLRLNKYQKI